MRKILPFLLLAGCVATWAQSPLGLLGWGNETSPADGPSRAMGDAASALRSDKNWDPRMEARSAQANLAAFEIQIAPQVVKVEGDTQSNTLGGGSLPRVSLSVPMGRFGHLGLGYFQRFQRDFEWNSGADSTLSIHSEGGAFEAVVGYSVVVPGVRNLSLGATYHRLLGSDRLYQETRLQFPDEYGEVVVRDSVSHRYWGDYWTVSAYWTKADIDAGLWVDFLGEAEVQQTRGANNQQFAPRQSKTVTPPASVGVAGAWRFDAKQSAVAQIARTSWEDAIPGSDARWDVGLGWQYKMGGDRFDDYWRQMSYRAGLSGSVGGPQSLLSESATVGAGMPMGPYGTLDLSLQIGQNEYDNGGPKLKDSFVRLYVSITGASLWGRSQRTHR
jgi:hypothetical protein